MPYVGNNPAANFASVTKDLFSGDGSTVAFTLSKAATTNGVAVFVENVRQEPTIAYAVSGTTLTFTAAPVSASGNNIYVLHHNAPASTATHPSAQALTAANATLTGDVAITGKTGMGISSTDVPDGGLHVHTGSSGSVSANSNGDELVVESSGRGGISILTPDANESNILFGSPSDNLGGFITYKQSTATMEIGTSISSGVFKINSGDGSLGFQIDGNGHVTKPLNCFVYVGKSADQTLTANDNNEVVTFDTELKDVNGDFGSNTFTAPVSGAYMVTITIATESVATNITDIFCRLTASNQHEVMWAGELNHIQVSSASGSKCFLQSAKMIYMDASDTFTVIFDSFSGVGNSTTYTVAGNDSALANDSMTLQVALLA